MKSINLSSIDLNLLVAFEAMTEQRSVTKAAEILAIGQPAMSAALSRLRELFKDPLFVRLGREMQPTAKAQQIAPAINAALHHIRHAIAGGTTFQARTSEHSFTLGSSDYTSYVLMPALLDFCTDQAPLVNLRTIEYQKKDIGELLEQGAVDIALGVFTEPPRQTTIEHLFEERFVGIVRRAHPALRKGKISLDSYVQFPHALTTLSRDYSGAIDKALDQVGLKRRIAFATPHLMVLPFTLASTDLIAAVPERIAKRLSNLCELKIFELPLDLKPWNVSLMWSALTNQDDANEWLRKALKQAAYRLA